MKWSTLLSVILLLFACRKNKAEFDGVNCAGNCFILKGKIYDMPSFNALEGVELKFYYRPPGYVIFYDPTRYLGHAFSNANGNYSFQFDGSSFKNSNGYYSIEAIKRNYFYNPFNLNDIAVFNLDSTQLNIPVVHNSPMFREAKLNVRFKATSVTGFEFLTFTYHFGNGATGIVLNVKRAIDTTISFTTAGDIKTFIQWDATGNGINIRKNDSLLIANGSSAFYQVTL